MTEKRCHETYPLELWLLDQAVPNESQVAGRNDGQRTYETKVSGPTEAGNLQKRKKAMSPNELECLLEELKENIAIIDKARERIDEITEVVEQSLVVDSSESTPN